MAQAKALGKPIIAGEMGIQAGTSCSVSLTQRAADYSALVAEVSDQHVATLAGNAPPEVISSERHAVKPWFQGRIPFSFNLPQDLPADVMLDGANLTYLRGQPNHP